MRYYLTVFLLLALFLPASNLAAQNTNPDLEKAQWPAEWITVPEVDAKGYGVYLFRKQFTLTREPGTFPVYISADNHYALYVNGEFVARGPAKGDLNHWNFDRIDLQPYLKKGQNTLAASVWNAGDYRQEAQISFMTGLIIQGETPAAAVVNTDKSWKCRQDSSYLPVPVSVYGPRPGMVGMYGYYVAGPGDRVDMEKKVTGWEMRAFAAADWQPAQPISRGVPRNSVGMDAREPWRLVASVVPAMERTPERFATVRRAEGVRVPSGFPASPASLEIPAGTSATILLDQGYLTNAFPSFSYRGGAGGVVVATYAEALYEADLRTKGNRDVVEGKSILGRQDSIFTSGSGGQTFSPLSYRTYRFVELKITTADAPLVIEDISATAVGYPFAQKATLNSPIAEMDTIMDIGWRTARMCAMDTYMDCPYWEQLQYIGDTRIQALVSLYNSGDDRLVKNALNLMDYSRQPEGITLSRYPTNIKQIIAPFSLWYIGMLRDYMWYGEDRAFVQDKLFGARQVLDYYAKFQAEDGSLQNLPNWSFADWVNGWQRGMPPMDEEGFSAVLDLQLLLAFQNARQLEAELGMEAFAVQYAQKIDQLATTIREKYWDDHRKLFADTKDHDLYSQHANALAILAGIVPEAEQEELGRRLLTEADLAPASIYFRYYLHQALIKAGLGDDYLSWLDIWRTNIDLGLTTWGESPNVAATRSDCHAWGSSPNIEFFRTILGIDSASPQFRTVSIAPRLGQIKTISGSMPHPAGMISVAYDLEAKKAEVSLPAGITGQFVWRGKTRSLKSGDNVLEL